MQGHYNQGFGVPGTWIGTGTLQMERPGFQQTTSRGSGLLPNATVSSIQFLNDRGILRCLGRVTTAESMRVSSKGSCVEFHLWDQVGHARANETPLVQGPILRWRTIMGPRLASAFFTVLANA